MLPSYRNRQLNQLTGSYMIGTLVIEGLIKEKNCWWFYPVWITFTFTTLYTVYDSITKVIKLMGSFFCKKEEKVVIFNLIQNFKIIFWDLRQSVSVRCGFGVVTLWLVVRVIANSFIIMTISDIMCHILHF